VPRNKQPKFLGLAHCKLAGAEIRHCQLGREQNSRKNGTPYEGMGKTQLKYPRTAPTTF